MNKGMIMLGFALLLMGLSFATLSWQYPWQEYVAWRYDCQIENIGTEKYILANYMYNHAQSYVQYSQILSMNNFLYYMSMANDRMTFVDYYAAPFRVDMGAYNSNNAAFNTIFNAVLRTYLQHGGNSIDVMNMLNGFNSDYRECISREPWGPTEVE
jgi:hypothetical protein